MKVWKNKSTPLEIKKYQLNFEDEADARKCIENYLEN